MATLFFLLRKIYKAYYERINRTARFIRGCDWSVNLHSCYKKDITKLIIMIASDLRILAGEKTTA